MNPELRILTVRQPWAWAIIHGGKDVENRLRNIAGEYRGPVAIHVGKREDDAGWSDRNFVEAWTRTSPIPGVFYRPLSPMWAEFGSIIGVVDLVDAHLCSGGCSPWALPTMQAEHRDWWHLGLKNPRALAEPIAFTGALGLRRLDDATTARVWAAIA